MKIFKRIVIVIVALLAVIAVALGIYIYQGKKALDSVDSNSTSVSDKINTGKPISILLLGADTGADGRIDRGNSDTMMIITLNPKTHKSVMYSIPRDTMAEIVGAGKKQKNVQKINAAYNIGKSDMAKKTVSKLLGIPVDYSVAINMGALEKAVNFVGGVTVTTPIKVSYDGITIPKGTHHLNGKQALSYVRMRYQDPRGDYGRQIRQQQVLKAVTKKLEQPKYLVKLPDLITKLGPDVDSDLTDSQMEKFPIKYHSAGKKLTTKQLQGQSAWINGSSYQILPTEVMQSASDKLRANLGLSKKTLNNTETKLNKLNSAYFKDPDNTDYDTNGLDTTYYTDNTF
ncbi:LCP family protein [Companilactobacillus allii]|uniref:LytR family transcriptional regulator n=1 Tax=Companilactobacillus allii TaxID=1847728 RepID=A0A1P8Q1W2_9LACO|nr:LCP family protein [Companilactobacillus allii]APX71848.1 LytR family transcriptional regulator [Companilactobacillus allii]USQ68935.1 LCP family protein [Companilactobacillus allii]